MKQPNRLLLIILGLALLGLTQCDKPQKQSSAIPSPTPATPLLPTASNPSPAASLLSSVSVPVITEGLSSSFRAVTSHLDLGGCSFQYSEAGGAAALAGFLDEVLKLLPEEKRKDVPPDFSFVNLFRILGLDSVVAVGASSRQRADGTYHSRSFAHMPKGRKGLMTLTGGPATKLLLHEVAPKDTDLAIEFPLNLKDFSRDALPGLLSLMSAAERSKFDHEMAAPQPPTGLSGKQIMEKLDARIGMFIRLDPTQKFQPAPDAPTFPGADGLIVMDHLGWLLEALKPQLMQAMEQPGSPATVTSEGDMFFIRFKAPAGPPPMDFQPVLRFDSKSDRILIATRPALMDSVTGGKDKISDNADFAQTWRDLPSEGNSCIYASTRLLQTVLNAVESAVQTATSKPGGPSEADAAIAQKMFGIFKPFFNRGQALVMSNQPDGITTTANTSIALGAGSGSLQTISVISILASVAMPVYSKIQEKGNETKELSRLKQLTVSLKIYATDHGKYPAQLTDLIKEGIIDDPSLLEFVNPVTHEHQAWIYYNSPTDISSSGSLLLAAPVSSKSGKRLAAFNDGSVRSITEAEFQQLFK